jgi:hypothetical protein
VMSSFCSTWNKGRGFSHEARHEVYSQSLEGLSAVNKRWSKGKSGVFLTEIGADRNARGRGRTQGSCANAPSPQTNSSRRGAGRRRERCRNGSRLQSGSSPRMPEDERESKRPRVGEARRADPRIRREAPSPQTQISREGTMPRSLFTMVRVASAL